LQEKRHASRRACLEQLKVKLGAGSALYAYFAGTGVERDRRAGGLGGLTGKST